MLPVFPQGELQRTCQKGLHSALGCLFCLQRGPQEGPAAGQVCRDTRAGCGGGAWVGEVPAHPGPRLTSSLWWRQPWAMGKVLLPLCLPEQQGPWERKGRATWGAVGLSGPPQWREGGGSTGSQVTCHPVRGRGVCWACLSDTEFEKVLLWVHGPPAEESDAKGKPPAPQCH